MKPNLKLFVALAALATSAAARAGTYDSNPGARHHADAKTSVSYGPSDAFDYELPTLKSADTDDREQGAGSGGGEPRADVTDHDQNQHAAWVQSIWTAP